MRGGMITRALICAAVSACVGCTYLLGLEDVTPADGSTGGAGGAAGSTTTSNGGGGQGPGGGGQGGGCPGQQQNCGSGCVDIGGDEANCGGCGRVCDTTCTAGRCVPFPVATGQSSPKSVTLSANDVYWIAGGNEVRRNQKTGPTDDTIETIFTMSGLNEIALGGMDQGIVFAGTTSGVLRADANVGATATQVTGSSGDISVVAANLTRVYWTDGGTTIQEAEVVSGNAAQFGGTEDSPKDIAATNNDVYWTTSATVRTARVATAVGVDVEAGSTQAPFYIAVGGTTVCWTQGAPVARVYCLADGAGSATEITAGEAPMAVAVPQNALGYVYWAEADRIQRRLIAGGPVETMAEGGGAITSLAADGTHVYWTNTNGAVLRQIVPSP